MQGKFQEALADVEMVLVHEPENAEAFARLGSLREDIGEFQNSVDAYSRAIALDPAADAYLNGRGVSYFRLGKLDEALADFDRALAIDAGDLTVLSNRGEVYMLKGDYKRALQDLDAVIAKDAKFGIAFGHRARTYAAMGDTARGMADFDRAVAASPDRADLWMQRGLLHEQLGSKDKALSDFRKALTLVATDNEARFAHENARTHIARLESGGAATSLPAPTRPSATTGPASGSPAKQGRRVALVIGNGRYKNTAVLTNPPNDAKAVAAAFKRVGFDEVVIQTDLDRAGMVAALQAFQNTAKGAEWALVYYAGHGIEVNGKTYLLPTDTKLAHENDIDDEAVDLMGRVMPRLAGAATLRMVILDSCRDNPFPNMGRVNGTRSASRGLAPIAPSRGELVIYATRHGDVAADAVGTGTLSPFTSTFLEHVETPGLDVDRLFRRVRDAVSNKTRGRQEPFAYGSLPDADLYFKTR